MGKPATAPAPDTARAAVRDALVQLNDAAAGLPAGYNIALGLALMALADRLDRLCEELGFS